MGTYYHTIRKLRRGSLPRRFVVIAAAPILERSGHGSPLFLETLRCGALTYLHRDGSNSWSIKDHDYTSGSEMLSLLNRCSNRKEATWLFAYNLGYTLTVSELWPHAIGGAVRVEGYSLQGAVQTLRMRVAGKLINCVDVRNYVQETMGWLYSACKMRPPPDYGSDDTDSLALDKARVQVSTIVEFIMRLVAMLDGYAGGSWGWSAGGIGWQSWRRGMMGCKVRVHAHPEATQMERDAYCGGRCEARYIGTVNTRVYELDFNSLYAHCMISTAMPVRLADVDSCSVGQLSKGLSEGRLAVARVMVDARLHDYPYLCWPQSSEPPCSSPSLPGYMAPRPQWRRIWGRGRFTTTLATPELRRALDNQELSGVSRVAWFEPGCPFGAFVDYWYARRIAYREQRKAIEEALAKRILTVIPGKFGQRSHEWLDVPGRKPVLPYGHWHEWEGKDRRFQLYRALAGHVQRYVPYRVTDLTDRGQHGHPEQVATLLAGEHRHSFPAISAHVTSGARVVVDNAVSIAGSLDCFRYDTDSLDVTGTGLERLADSVLVSQTELGKLKVVKHGFGASYRNARDCTIHTAGIGEAVNANHSHAVDTELPAVCGNGSVHQLFRPGADGWRSCVSVAFAARYRYAGRTGADGWVRPLWIPSDCPGHRSGELDYGSEKGAYYR